MNRQCELIGWILNIGSKKIVKLVGPNEEQRARTFMRWLEKHLKSHEYAVFAATTGLLSGKPLAYFEAAKQLVKSETMVRKTYSNVERKLRQPWRSNELRCLLGIELQFPKRTDEITNWHELSPGISKVFNRQGIWNIEQLAGMSALQDLNQANTVALITLIEWARDPRTFRKSERWR